jgi:hypothetical protein
MDDKLQDVILDEIKMLRAEIRGLHKDHVELKNRVYLISIALGIVSGELKNVVEKFLL